MLMFFKNLWYYVWIKQDKKKAKSSSFGDIKIIFGN